MSVCLCGYVCVDVRVCVWMSVFCGCLAVWMCVDVDAWMCECRVCVCVSELTR